MQIHMRFTYSLKEDKEDESEEQEAPGGDDENPTALETRRERKVRRDEERQSIQIKGLQKSQKQKPGSSACSMDKKLPWRKRSEEQRR